MTYDGPRLEPIPIPEAGTDRQRIEVDPESSGLKDAVVWLEGVPPPGKPTTPTGTAPVRIDQRDYRFIPHVLAVESGRPVEFLNSDAANHGVTATSPRAENCFNVSTAPEGRYVHRFVAVNRPVAIGCPIHGAMAAWIYVFDHPYHAVTDANGTFRLPRVPPGRYTLHVHHGDSGLERRQAIQVGPGAPARFRIAFGKDDLKARARP